MKRTAKKDFIKKNLSDADMLAKWTEETTFETSESVFTQPEKPKKPSKAEDMNFFTQELLNSLDRALLELKIKLYKEGIIDYKIKVSQEGRQVLLSAVPVKNNGLKEKK